ncbi:MAG: hypothetical protein AAFP02_08060 [Bacteroidota bacterium]
MKNFFFGFCFILCAITSLHGQNLRLTPNIGYGAPILDTGHALHLGVNPDWALGDFFALEGQVSYLYTSVEAAFLSGERNTEHAFNVLAGGRLYVRRPEKSFRPYINLLFGVAHWREFSPLNPVRMNTTVGASAGVFADIQNWVVGVSVDTPGKFVFKAGYRF